MTRSAQPLGRHQHTPFWLWALVLVCAALVLASGTAQVCHVHHADPVHPGRVLLSATPQECPWCAATQVAMAATTHTTIAFLPRYETLEPRRARTAARSLWGSDLVCRPPPAARPLTALWVEGTAVTPPQPAFPG